MSYVYCGYCGQRGHNKLGCPKRKADARANPESYLARQIAREKESRERAVANRTCSYCRKPGHNRRGCQVLKEDKKLIMKRQKEYVDEFLSSCKSSGFGPGSLVKIAHGSNREDPYAKYVMALVTTFVWDEIDFLNSDYKSSSWGVRNRTLAKARVVGSYGFPEDDEWRSPPRQNEVVHLQHDQLIGVLDIIPQMNEHTGPPATEVVGPAQGAFTVPDPILTRMINRTFQLHPGSRAKDWEKCRKSITNEEWSNVRSAEHAAALEKIQ